MFYNSNYNIKNYYYINLNIILKGYKYKVKEELEV